MTAKSKPVIPRKQAEIDIEAAFGYYLSEAGSEIATSFIDALEQAMLHLSRSPATGSPRYAHELNIPGLRHWPLKRFPWLIFYMEHEAHVEVWRLLHAERDIPSWMQGSE